MSKTSASSIPPRFVFLRKSMFSISYLNNILISKALVILALCLFLAQNTQAQELRCNVQVMSSKIEGTNKKVYETLQKAIYEFMNNRVWTNHTYTAEERIECSILINITSQLSADEFSGTMQIQSRRPVFNTSLNTTMLNYMDNNISFRYVEFEPLNFSETSFTSNITSLLAYYAYMIIGLDYDSFSNEGGTEYFKKAENIVTNAQSATDKGWKAFDSKNNKNRYWLVKNVLDEKYSPVREFYYRYHRQGLDVMSSKVDAGRTTIAESLELLQTVFRNKPDVYLNYLQIVFDSKSDEFVNIFSESFPEEKNRISTLLREIDPSNTSKYEKLTKAN